MGEKDLSEKILADYNDVFADIVNVLILKGERQITPEDLASTAVHSQYKADDDILHEQERDVSKYWEKQKIHMALFSMENQSTIEKNMPFRIIGYDGVAYRQQLLRKERPVPVITLVLHFGTDRPWDQPCSIKELLDIPEALDEYVSDYNIHVFDIAWLPDEQVAMFQSDFGIVADFFVQKRKNKEYIPEDHRIIQHVDEVLKLLSVMTGDKRYTRLFSPGPKEGITMCDVAERLEQRGIKRGIEQGIELGIEQGIELTLYSLTANGKLSISDASEELHQTEEEFLTGMKNAGYELPDTK